MLCIFVQHLKYSPQFNCLSNKQVHVQSSFAKHSRQVVIKFKYCNEIIEDNSCGTIIELDLNVIVIIQATNVQLLH